MARRPAHPDRQLFDYLKGVLEVSSARRVEQHLNECSECSRAVALFRTLKATRQVSTGGGELVHPDASEIAALFYRKSAGASPRTAAHVATCRSCADELSEYARAEAAASVYIPSRHAYGEAPAASWEMIREWEESSFAKPRSAPEVIDQELLAKLFNLIGKRGDWLRDAHLTAPNPGSGTVSAAGVSVFVVDRSGEVRSVEMFVKVTDATGADVLRHADKSARFDNRQVHALHDAAGRQRVVSYRVECDTIRFEEASSEESTDYFIVED